MMFGAILSSIDFRASGHDAVFVLVPIAVIALGGQRMPAVSTDVFAETLLDPLENPDYS